MRFLERAELAACKTLASAGIESLEAAAGL